MNNIPNNPEQSQILLNQLVHDFMKDQKHKRLWRWIRRFIILVLILLVYFKMLAVSAEENKKTIKPHVGLIDIKGTILDTDLGSAEYFAKGMDAAYKKKGLKALIIRINSPGGSPVQSDYMFNTIQYYQKAYPNVKIYAVCVDVCASGAYYVASAATEIYANESSLVGSIGVLYNGFGFVDTLQKLGITRRLQTAGRNKAMLDPFSPLDKDSQQFLQVMLDDIHKEFINKVTLGRKGRLKIEADTFSGLFWTGKQALERGLIDGFASSGQLARDRLKLKEVIDYTYKQSVLERVTRGIGVALLESIPQALGIRSGIKVELY